MVVGGSVSRSSLRTEGRAEGGRPGFWRGAQRQARARARRVRATCGDGDRVPGEGSNAQGSGAAAHKGATQGERYNGRRAAGRGAQPNPRTRARRGPGADGRCERSDSQRAHVVSRRRIVGEVVRLNARAPRSRVSVARSRCAQGKRRPSVARVGGVTVGRVERHLGRVALKRSCPSAHGRARRPDLAI